MDDQGTICISFIFRTICLTRKKLPEEQVYSMKRIRATAEAEVNRPPEAITSKKILLHCRLLSGEEDDKQSSIQRQSRISYNICSVVSFLLKR